AVRFAIGSEKECVICAVPIPVAAVAKSAVVILKQGEWTFGRTLLSRNQIEHPIRFRLGLDSIDTHLPALIQRYLRLSSGEIDKAMPRLESALDRAAPEFVERHELDAPFAIAHVPEVRMPAFKFGFRPGE